MLGRIRARPANSSDVLRIQQARSIRPSSLAAARLDQGRWGVPKTIGAAKFYELTKSGRRQLESKGPGQTDGRDGPGAWNRPGDSGMLSDIFFRLRSLFRRNTVEAELGRRASLSLRTAESKSASVPV